MIVYPPSPSGRPSKRTSVQWRHTNVQDGLVRTDPDMLSKLVSREPLHKYYKLDPTPFAKGMFASVWRCRSIASGEVFAAKFSSRYRYGEDCTSEIHHEIALLSLCSPSPKIIKLHDVFQTPKEFIIVMEYAPGGDMQTLIDDNLVPYEHDVVKYIHDVVESLAYLHHRKIAHLDIKPQNLVMMGEFPDCEIKVCDLEISRVVLDGTEVHEILGTPEYVAPEILHYEPITLAADMWSLGVTTYVLLTGFSPFGGETDQETFLNISRAQVDFPDELFEDVSEDAKDFMKKLLLRNPSERMTAKKALRHPWLVKARKTRQLNRRSATRGGTETRIGCASCPSSNTTLRGYLSKSREALFEKVMTKGDLRKTTLVQQYNRTRRMCESQMSLVARDKSLRKESRMSRSREKLYGLKSLSKSQEVLSLYKSVLNLNDDVFKLNEEKEIVEPSVNVPEEAQTRKDSETVEMRTIEETEAPTSLDSTEAITTSESDISEEEESLKGSETCDLRLWEGVEEPVTAEKQSNEDEDEPKFTVAQLVSAYNKHQEIMTKSSLEVTMTKQRFENKLGEVFPTGPNALRLFIPDIQLRNSKPKQKKKKRMPRKKTGLPNAPFEEDETEVTEEGTPNERLDLEIFTKSAEESELDKLVDPLRDRLGVTTPPPKYLRSETSPEPKQEKKKPPYYMSPFELRQTPMPNVAKTVELFNNYRPDRKSFSAPPAPAPPQEKTRRKSSPPTMKPF